MATSWNAQSVMCPFYVKDEKTIITCEGFPGATVHKQVYPNRASLQKQIEIYCSTWNHKRCEAYRLIMNSKYHDEE